MQMIRQGPHLAIIARPTSSCAANKFAAGTGIGQATLGKWRAQFEPPLASRQAS